jgi:hypothetical protein
MAKGLVFEKDPFWLTEKEGAADRLDDFAAIALSDGRKDMSKQLKAIAQQLREKKLI